MATERDVVMRLKAKADGLRDIRETTQAVKDLTAAQKAFNLEQDKTADRAHSASRKLAAEDMMAALGMGNARPRRWDQNRRGETARQARDAAASILELHEAPAHLIEDVRLSSKNRRDKLHAEQSVKEQTHQQAMQSLMEQEIGKSEVEYLKLREKAIKAIEEQNRQLEIQKRLEQDLVKLGYAESQAMRGEAVPQAKKGAGGLVGKGLEFVMSPSGIASAIGMAVAVKIGETVAKEITNRVAGQRIAEYGYTRSGRFGIDSYARSKRELEADEATVRGLTSWIPGMGGAVETGLYARRLHSEPYRIEQNLREAHEAQQWMQARGERETDFRIQRNQHQRELARYLIVGGMSEENRQGLIAAQRRSIQQNQDLRMPTGSVAATEIERINNENAKRRLTRQQATQQIANLSALQAVKGVGMNSAGQQALLQQKAQEAGLARQQELMERPGAGGYDHRAALGDYEARIQAKTRRQQVEAENRRQKAIIGADVALTGTQQQLAKERLARAEMGLAAAQRNRNISGLRHDQVEQKDLALKAARIEKEQAEKELSEANLHAKEMQVHQMELMNELSIKQISLLGEEGSRLRGIIREENAREMGRRERFGLMNPMKQRTYVAIAKKMAAGGRLTQREIEAASGAPELFGKRLTDLAMQRTDKGSAYEQIKRLLPELGERKRQAEQHLANVNQQFHVEIKLNEKALADQIQKQVMSKVYEALNQVVRSAEDARQRAAHEHRMRQNAGFGQ